MEQPPAYAPQQAFVAQGQPVFNVPRMAVHRPVYVTTPPGTGYPQGPATSQPAQYQNGVVTHPNMTPPVVTPPVVTNPSATQPVVKEVQDNLLLAVFACCCFCPLGLLAIYKSKQVRSAQARNDIQQANAHAQSSRNISIIAIVIGIIILIILGTLGIFIIQGIIFVEFVEAARRTKDADFDDFNKRYDDNTFSPLNRFPN